MKGVRMKAREKKKAEQQLKAERARLQLKLDDFLERNPGSGSSFVVSLKERISKLNVEILRVLNGSLK